ncbi:MAG: DNA-binding protein [Leifsonia sp.]|jgi:predicted XRE-type DNA-binding protein|nr:DNA-binding protein [Leifsonia sp.]MDQ1587093.1 hypothetical protein [Microbacteriaceae bacterium]
MFVITADQIDSRSTTDVAGSTRDSINRDHGGRLLLPADRNAGDEIQALTDDAGTALALVLELTRTGQWSVGLGCGGIRLPLPSATREASGEAFFAARDAVSRAKKQQTRFAIEARSADEAGQTWPGGEDAEALVNLLLLLRERRSPAGWELYDLISAGMAQSEAAVRLGITPPSVSSRARAAGIRLELASIGALTRLLENLDRASTGTDAHE